MSVWNAILGVVVGALAGGIIAAPFLLIWFGVVYGLTTPYERKQHRLRQEAKRNGSGQ